MAFNGCFLSLSPLLTCSLSLVLDSPILRFVAEDFAGVGDVESWGFVAALPVHDCEVNAFDINTASYQLRQIALADPSLSHIALIAGWFALSLNAADSYRD